MANRIKTNDALISSGLAALTTELTKLDSTINEPLSNFTWSRDVPVKVGGGDLSTMYTRYSKRFYSSPVGGMDTAGGQVNDIVEAGGGLDTFYAPANPFTIQLQIGYLNLQRDNGLINVGGQSLQEVLEGSVRMNYNSTLNRFVYLGGPAAAGATATGLLNNPDVAVTAPINGNWATTATPAQMLEDINNAINTIWATTNYDPTAVPNHILVPPRAYERLVGTIVSDAGNMSVLTFLQQNNVATSMMGVDLVIAPLPLLTTSGAGNTDRMIVYSNNERFVNFDLLAPLTLGDTGYSPDKVAYISTYFANFGAVKFVYPETAIYVDGIL